MEMKTCRLCGQSKPMDKANFYVRKKYRGGFSHECKPCFRSDYNRRYGNQNAKKPSANDAYLPQARTEMIDQGNGVTLVRFGYGFKPGKAQTHGSASGYQSALANTSESIG